MLLPKNAGGKQPFFDPYTGTAILTLKLELNIDLDQELII